MINIETKAHLPNLDKVKEIIVAGKGEHIKTMHQIDTYFKVGNGDRLKLRVIDNVDAVLVGYKRQNDSDTKQSERKATHISNVDNTKDLCDFMFGRLVEVIKFRELWIIDHTRIHLDQVEGLGTYIELETLAEGISVEEAKVEHTELLKHLEINEDDYINVSYSDLLLGSHATTLV